MDVPYEEFNLHIIESESYKAYDLVKSVIWAFLTHVLLYCMLILIPNIYATAPIYLFGLITVFIMLFGPIKRAKIYYKNEKVRREFIATAISQLVILVLDLFLVVLMFIVYFAVSIGAIFADFYLVTFLITYYVRYLVWAYVIYSVSGFHTIFAKRFSYQHKGFIVGYFLYPFIFYKLIVFNSDIYLMARIQISLGYTLTGFLSNFVVLLVCQLVFVGIILGLIIEANFKLFKVSKAMLAEANH